jgi:hypothetical protein
MLSRSLIGHSERLDRVESPNRVHGRVLSDVQQHVALAIGAAVPPADDKFVEDPDEPRVVRIRHVPFAVFKEHGASEATSKRQPVAKPWTAHGCDTGSAFQPDRGTQPVTARREVDEALKCDPIWIVGPATFVQKQRAGCALQ